MPSRRHPELTSTAISYVFAIPSHQASAGASVTCPTISPVAVYARASLQSERRASPSRRTCSRSGRRAKARSPLSALRRSTSAGGQRSWRKTGPAGVTRVLSWEMTFSQVSSSCNRTVVRAVWGIFIHPSLPYEHPFCNSSLPCHRTDHLVCFSLLDLRPIGLKSSITEIRLCCQGAGYQKLQPGQQRRRNHRREARLMIRECTQQPVAARQH